MTQLPDAPNDLAAGNMAPAEAQPAGRGFDCFAHHGCFARHSCE